LTHTGAVPLFTGPVGYLDSGWSATTAYGNSLPGVVVDSEGIVHLVGGVSATGTPNEASCGALGGVAGDRTAIGQLTNNAWWPAQNVERVVHTYAGTYADLTISTTGAICLTAPPSPLVTDYRFVSLEGISYAPSGNPDPGESQPIALNGPSWSPIQIPDSVEPEAPSWFQDRDGTVHLEGSADFSDSLEEPFSNFVGTLPQSIRPSRSVYTVVATACNIYGTYADLVITPQGQILLINPRPPASSYSYWGPVSLDGITYQP
jgi:hypothetical protein